MKKESDTHPSKDITCTEGEELKDRRIILCITGSVAAYRAIDLARLLMRHGADVHAVMTESTTDPMLLSPEMMKWATGNNVVTKLTGNLEHIMFADYDMSDLVIVYPCTANTIGKMANGIDDTSVTSILSVALGSKIPIIIAPAMHEAMYENCFIKENVQKLKNHVTFAEPKITEGKAKVATQEQVLMLAISIISSGPLSGKRVLVTAGSTIEYIDPIRVITNQSSGKMGIAIAQQARKMGASVTLIYGHGTQQEPADCKVIHTSTNSQMYDMVISELSSKKYDIVIMAAAVADFAPEKKSERKIDTREGRIQLSLITTKKIVDEIKNKDRRIFLVAFKADYNVSHSTLIEKANKKLQECNADMIVANDLGKNDLREGSDNNEVFIIDRKGEIKHLPLENKTSIARKILEQILESLENNNNNKQQ
jgi:phosphopantothenoylcysteine decarboxylase/phosphopantothenate--cysteine ligase